MGSAPSGKPTDPNQTANKILYVISLAVINCWLFRAKGMKSVDRVTNEIVATQGQGNT
jgi:hypothetical protein